MSNYFPSPEVPNLLRAPGFDIALQQFTQDVLDYTLKTDPSNLANVTAAIQDDAGMFAKVVQGCCYVANLKMQQANVKALQLFSSFAKHDMLDAKVADLGLRRQVIQEADAELTPPKFEILESDDSLLTRYYLASFAIKPGSRKGYEFHARTVGDRPVITVDQSVPGEINVKYKFSDDSNAKKVRDAACRKTSPGHVDIYILANDGLADAELVSSVSGYIHREDIKEETDVVTVKAATHLDYVIHVRVKNTLAQNPAFIKEQLEIELSKYAYKQRKLDANVNATHVGGILYAKNLPEYEVVSPAVEIKGDANSAPNCTQIIVEIV